MSELKTTTVYDAYWKANSVGEGTGIQVYLKSEADKVIAEKDKFIADLEESQKKEVEQLLILNREQANAANRLRNSMEQVIRHQKYKRCLAMAEMCKARYDEEDARVNGRGASWDYISEEMKCWERWHKRWLALAEKFKPNTQRGGF